MSVALVATLTIITVSVAYAHGYRSAIEAKGSNAGWYGLVVLVLLLTGLFTSGHAGNGPAAYGFAITLSLTLPTILLIGIASAIGRAMGKGKTQ